MSGPVERSARQRRDRLDRLALAITALGEDLTDWTAGELAQLHMMGMDLARRTNLALSECEEPRE